MICDSIGVDDYREKEVGIQDIIPYIHVSQQLIVGRINYYFSVDF